MGGSPKQVNSAQASQADQAAQQSEQASANLTNQNAQQAKQNYNYLFGANGPGSGGSLDQFLDPSTLSTKAGSPQGNYLTAYNNSKNQLAQSYSNQRGSLAQQWANNGFAGGMPSGFMADQQRKLANSQADSEGSLYAGTVGQQYSDALNNFWNANNLAAGQAATSTGAAVSSAANEGNTAANVYSTAGRQAQMNNPINSAISAGGTVGAAALCPARGAKIHTKRGTVNIEDLSAGDWVFQSDGQYRRLPKDPHMVLAECVEIDTQRGRHSKVSEGHGFCSAGGGYVDAIESGLCEVRGRGEVDLVSSVAKVGRCEVFVMPKFGNNTYLVDDLWSLT